MSGVCLLTGGTWRRLRRLKRGRVEQHEEAQRDFPVASNVFLEHSVKIRSRVVRIRRWRLTLRSSARQFIARVACIRLLRRQSRCHCPIVVGFEFLLAGFVIHDPPSGNDRRLDDGIFLMGLGDARRDRFERRKQLLVDKLLRVAVRAEAAKCEQKASLLAGLIADARWTGWALLRHALLRQALLRKSA